jgi:hypothetical protein
MNPANWPSVAARIVPGHRVASGLNANPRFPGGTLLMQAPFFRALGFDLGVYHQGTMNVSIAPHRYRVVKAPTTFRQVKWHPIEPAEDFSFFDVQLTLVGAPPVAGKIYYPHPDTKPAHFQQPDVLELLLPLVKGLKYGDEVQLRIPSEQMILEAATPKTL